MLSLVLPAGFPGRKRPSPTRWRPVMEVAPTITFRRIRSSAVLEADIRNRLAKLETLIPSIIGAHVLVDLADRRHRDGQRWRVRIEVSVPGERIVVTHERQRASRPSRQRGREDTEAGRARCGVRAREGGGARRVRGGPSSAAGLRAPTARHEVGTLASEAGAIPLRRDRNVRVQVGGASHVGWARSARRRPHPPAARVPNHPMARPINAPARTSEGQCAPT